ncbi:HMG-Y-related protein A [Spatholobus suberectus]|nr:HMG-Y-related protein A [Spatholobus suberectus]
MGGADAVVVIVEIMKALEALNEPSGSSKSAISKHIESTYGELPDSNLLVQHLNKMKESGELVFLKNNYMKPDPNAPPKRAVEGHQNQRFLCLQALFCPLQGQGVPLRTQMPHQEPKG